MNKIAEKLPIPGFIGPYNDPGKPYLPELREESWKLSRKVAIGSSFTCGLAKEIREFNQKIEDNKKAFADEMGCTVRDVEELKVIAPKSKWRRFGDNLSVVFRVIFVVLRVLFIMPMMLVKSIFFKRNTDPKKIVKFKTPVLLIHGSSANQRQWDTFRSSLKGKETGHIFTLNLNDKAFQNDKKSISEYAQQRIAKKIEEIRDRYAAEGYKLDEIIFGGHSMGGLVGAEYALHHATDVKVSALFAMSTPWGGSKLADKLFKLDKKPEGTFVTTNPESIERRKQLIEAERQGKINVYTFSSSLDPIVRPMSSSLPIRPSHQLYSQNHDHYTSMLDPWLSRRIRQRFVVPNTHDLPRLRQKQKVHFGGARARPFSKSEAPVEVGQVDSILLGDIGQTQPRKL